jgi:hypothetical protein
MNTWVCSVTFGQVKSETGFVFQARLYQMPGGDADI